MIDRMRLQNLTLGRAGSEPLFEGLDFELPLDGTYWVKGDTGSGKSSLLRLLACLEDPLEGSYFINDTDLTRLSFEEVAPFRRRIGYGFAEGGLISNRTLRQNLMLPFFYHRDLTAEQAESRVNEYVSRFRLAAARDLRPAQVSSGTRKACVVARSLILRPELLVLDQPTSGLDATDARTLVDLIRHHRGHEGLRHVFVVSEDADFINQFEHRVLEIRSRKIHLPEEPAA